MGKIVILTSDEADDRTVMLVPNDYDPYEIEKIADDNEIPAPTILECAISQRLEDFLVRNGVEHYRPFTG